MSKSVLDFVSTIGCVKLVVLCCRSGDLQFLFNELLLLEFSTCWKFSVKGKSLGNGGVNSEGKFHSTPLTPKPKDINGNRNVLGYTNTPNKRYPKQIASQLP